MKNSLKICSCFGCGKSLDTNKEFFAVFPDINKNQIYLCKKCLKDIERNKTMDKGSYLVDGSYFVDNRAVEGQKFINQKVIAKITLCGVFEMTVYGYMNWNPPTTEQIKNLKETFNIDVELIGEKNDL